MTPDKAVAATLPPRKPARRRARPVTDPCRLPGLDARTAAGKRYTQIAAALVAEYPGADTSRVRELALLKLAIELRQAKLLNDDPAQADELVRLSNLSARRERDLRLRRRYTNLPSFYQRLVAEAKGAPTS